jgi:hypothetical protein
MPVDGTSTRIMHIPSTSSALVGQGNTAAVIRSEHGSTSGLAGSVDGLGDAMGVELGRKTTIGLGMHEGMGATGKVRTQIRWELVENTTYPSGHTGAVEDTAWVSMQALYSGL